jgi:uncharacterized membrane protein YgaE (UPF0421/DUF939 family)
MEMNMSNELNSDKSRKGKSANSLAMGIAIGIALGAGIGVAIHNIAIGIGIGVALGVTLYSIIGRRQKNNVVQK